MERKRENAGRCAFESVRMELFSLRRGDVITTSNPTGFDGEEEEFTLTGELKGGEQ